MKGYPNLILLLFYCQDLGEDIFYVVVGRVRRKAMQAVREARSSRVFAAMLCRCKTSDINIMRTTGLEISVV